MAHILFLLDRAAKGPQERPRFHDNINPSLGEDAEVESGTQGTGGRCRSVEGGENKGPRGAPQHVQPVGIIRVGPNGQAIMPGRPLEEGPEGCALTRASPSAGATARDAPCSWAASSPGGAPSTQHPSPLSSTCPSAVLTPAATTQHDHR